MGVNAHPTYLFIGSKNKMAKKKKLIVKKPLIGAFGISNYPGDYVDIKDKELKEEMLVKGYIEEEEKKEETTAEAGVEE
jgi:hypothetical protein